MFYFCTFIAFTSFLLLHSIAFMREVCAFSGRYIAIGSVKLFVLDKFNLQQMSQCVKNGCANLCNIFQSSNCKVWAISQSCNHR